MSLALEQDIIIEAATTKVHPVPDTDRDVEMVDEDTGDSITKKYTNIRCTPTGVSSTQDGLMTC